MKDQFLEDLGDEFPINSAVRCGQADYRLGFAHMTLEDALSTFKARVPRRAESRRFLPAALPRR
ncbi:MAG: hypothetical protein ACN6QH_02300 [Pseudomonas sp.]|uniref:hypothetical protein n=1 Tax=Pseudomonas sp. TaxID=306 RepID=UPI003D0E26EB